VVEKLRAALSDTAGALRTYETRIGDLKSLFEHDLASVLDANGAAGVREQPKALFAETSAALTRLLEAHGRVSEAGDRVEHAVLANAPGAAAFHTFATFEQFLGKAKQLWDQVPTSEREALSRARDWYVKAYENGSEIAEGVSQLQAGYIIGELSRRIGDHAAADRYFNEAVKTGWNLVSGGQHDAATVNRARKLLDMGREQAKLNTEAKVKSKK
jgi:hypothetical protein